MLEEELQEMQRKVEEARNHLIELNDQYNELLTREHEEEFKRTQKLNNSLLFSRAYEENPMTEEEMMISKISFWYFVRNSCIIFLELFGLLSLFPAIALFLINAGYSSKKTKKVRKEYSGKTDEKKKGIMEKIDKDALYEEVFEARTIYHNLRKEYESKQFNVTLKESLGNIEEINGSDCSINPQLYQLYLDYIEYVRTVSIDGRGRSLDEKRKTYEKNVDVLKK